MSKRVYNYQIPHTPTQALVVVCLVLSKTPTLMTRDVISFVRRHNPKIDRQSVLYILRRLMQMELLSGEKYGNRMVFRAPNSLYWRTDMLAAAKPFLPESVRRMVRLHERNHTIHKT